MVIRRFPKISQSRRVREDPYYVLMYYLPWGLLRNCEVFGSLRRITFVSSYTYHYVMDSVEHCLANCTFLGV